MLTLDQKKASLIWSKCHLQINDAQAKDSYHNRHLFNKSLKVMLHEAICKDDFQGNNVGALFKQFGTIPQQCWNALLVVTNWPQWHRLKKEIGSLSLHSCRLSPFPWLLTRQIPPWHRYFFSACPNDICLRNSWLCKSFSNKRGLIGWGDLSF